MNWTRYYDLARAVVTFWSLTQRVPGTNTVYHVCTRGFHKRTKMVTLALSVADPGFSPGGGAS